MRILLSRRLAYCVKAVCSSALGFVVCTMLAWFAMQIALLLYMQRDGW